MTMRFQVPQFIEVEDKIFGPLTLRQFIYIAGGAGLSFIVYRTLPFIIAIIPILLIVAFSAALAFYKVHEKQPFLNLIEAAAKFYFKNKLYIWKKTDIPAQTTQANKGVDGKPNEYASIMVPKISQSKLKDLTWSLDIKESMYSDKNQK